MTGTEHTPAPPPSDEGIASSLRAYMCWVHGPEAAGCLGRTQQMTTRAIALLALQLVVQVAVRLGNVVWLLAAHQGIRLGPPPPESCLVDDEAAEM